MTIKDKKAKLKEYQDFHGGDLISIDQIDYAKSNLELREIIYRHKTFLEDQLCDAIQHLEGFAKELDLF